MHKYLLSFGHGYSAQALACNLLPLGWKIIGTTRDKKKLLKLRETGIQPYLWGDSGIEEAFSKATAVLISAGPNEEGDPVFLRYNKLFKKYAAKLDWVGYLSTTGVYGDFNGQWVDENSETKPGSKNGIERLKAEKLWIEISKKYNLQLQIFRLSGIYSNQSNILKRLKTKEVKIVNKKNQFFSRIHLEDIANVLFKSLEIFKKGEIYNISDDKPASMEEVINYGTKLLGVDKPKTIEVDQLENEMLRNFYKDSKKISNKKMKKFFKYELKYPTYIEGLNNIYNNSI